MKIQDLINNSIESAKAEKENTVSLRAKSFLPTFRFSDKADSNVTIILLDTALVPFPWITLAYHFELREAKPRNLGRTWPPCLNYLKNALPKSPSPEMVGWSELNRDDICPVEEAFSKFSIPRELSKSLRKTEIIYFYSVWKDQGDSTLKTGFLWEYAYKSELLPLLVQILDGKDIYPNMAISIRSRSIVDPQKVEKHKEILITEDNVNLIWSSLTYGPVYSSLFKSDGVDLLRETYIEAIQALVFQSNDNEWLSPEKESLLDEAEGFVSKERMKEDIEEEEGIGELSPDDFVLPDFGSDDFDRK